MKKIESNEMFLTKVKSELEIVLDKNYKKNSFKTDVLYYLYAKVELALFDIESLNNENFSSNTVSNISFDNSSFSISIAGFLWDEYETSLSYMGEVWANTVRFMSHESWWALIWEYVEEEKWVFDWSILDKIYSEANEKGLSPMVNIYPSPPDWDNDDTDIIMAYPNDLTEYLTFIEKIAERYDGDGIDDVPNSPIVNSWILGTEMWRGEGWNEKYGKIWWDWDETDYVDLFVKTNLAIKKANPNATLLS